MITSDEALKEAEGFRKLVQQSKDTDKIKEVGIELKTLMNAPAYAKSEYTSMKAIVEDDSIIAAVEFSDGTLVEIGKLCVFVKLLTSKVTRIVAYSEESPAGYTPWVAIYCEDEIVGRGDLSGAKIVYKQNEE